MAVAKLTSKNQLTLPKAIVEQLGAAHYFEVVYKQGSVVLTPLHLGRADSVRDKLAKLNLRESDVQDAVAWARKKAS